MESNKVQYFYGNINEPEIRKQLSSNENYTDNCNVLQNAISALENEINQISKTNYPNDNTFPKYNTAQNAAANGSPHKFEHSLTSNGHIIDEEHFGNSRSSNYSGTTPISSNHYDSTNANINNNDNYEVITYFNDIYLPSQEEEDEDSNELENGSNPNSSKNSSPIKHNGTSVLASPQQSLLSIIAQKYTQNYPYAKADGQQAIAVSSSPNDINNNETYTPYSSNAHNTNARTTSTTLLLNQSNHRSLINDKYNSQDNALLNDHKNTNTNYKIMQSSNNNNNNIIYEPAHLPYTSKATKNEQPTIETKLINYGNFTNDASQYSNNANSAVNKIISSNQNNTPNYYIARASYQVSSAPNYHSLVSSNSNNSKNNNIYYADDRGLQEEENNHFALNSKNKNNYAKNVDRNSAALFKDHHHTTTNGINNVNTSFLSHNRSSTSKGNVSEISSLCEFDSDGEELHESLNNRSRDNNRYSEFNGDIVRQSEVCEPNTKVSKVQNQHIKNDLESFLQIPDPKKVDKYGFFGGAQYLLNEHDSFDTDHTSNAMITSEEIGDDEKGTLKADIQPSYSSQNQMAKYKSPHTKPEVDKKRVRELGKLRNREKKWKGMLDHWEKYVKHRPEKIRDRCRKGIPPSLRGLAWQFLCGVPALRGRNTELFRLLASEDQKGDPLVIDEIRRDLHRQFPYHEMFAQPNGTGQRDLFAVLKVYSLMRPKDGYCQAQAPLAAVLLMQMPAEPAFWCLLSICDNYLPGYFGHGLEALQLDGQLFYGLLKRQLPAVYRLIKKQGIQPSLCLTEWFMCVYSRTLSWPCVLRIWDLFLSEGITTLYKVGLVLFKLAFYGKDGTGEKGTTTNQSKKSNKSIPSTSNASPTMALHAYSNETSSNHSIFGSLPLLHFGSSSLATRFPSMYESMGALQALKSKTIDEDYLIAEVLKIKISKELIERERQTQLQKQKIT